MIKNYFKIAWRNLWKHKGFSIVNIVGLSIGVSACLLITLFVLDETSYDKQIPNADNIYKLLHYFNMKGSDEWGAHHTAIMASTIDREFDEVENAGRILDNHLMYGAGSNEISFDETPTQYHEENFAYADQSILDIFELEMVYGDAVSALTEPYTIVITESKAKKFFKDKNPVGQSIILNGNTSEPYRITGVFKDFPDNSNFDYNFLLTLKGVEFGPGEQTRWTQRNYFNYIQLKPGTDFERFEKRLTEVIFTNYMLPAYRDSGRLQNAKMLAEQSYLELQPLKRIHLYSDQINDGKKHGDIRFVWTFAVIALFILIIACVNFINLSTAKSATRAKEVGLRKVVGSGRGRIIMQFLTESILITVIAFGVGLLLSWLCLPFFNNTADKTLTMPWDSWLFIPSILILAIIIGIIAGLYPAFYLSGFKPINVLKGKLNTGSKSSGLRSGLVIFQFTVSIILIAGTLIIHNQMDFILNKKIGFEKDHVIQIHGVNMLGEQITSFTNELKKIHGVQQISNSDYLPIADTKRNGNTFYNKEKNKGETIPSQAWAVDENYLETFGMKLEQGRNFDPTRTTDQEAVIINQVLAKDLGMENPIGKEMLRDDRTYTIIGVVEDFNFESLKQKVGALALFYYVDTTITSVKVNTADVSGLLVSLKNKWKEFVPNLDFRYTFMDASYAKMYANVERMGKLFISFAILAILVACLGLFALSSFLVEQRKKEMSIRKVLGASVQTLFRLLTSYFMVLVLIAITVAVPISYYIMNNWLKDYAYRIDISWKVFAISGILAIFIALTTISYHAFRAALINPAKNLKNE